MVQIATAWAVNRNTGEGHEVAARDIDPQSKDHDYFCPDKCCRVPLAFYSQYTRPFDDPETGKTFHATVAAHFQRQPHGPTHAKKCNAVDDFTKYMAYARDNALSLDEDRAFVFNLNIPTSDRPAPIRKNPSAITRHFQEKAMAESRPADDKAVAEHQKDKQRSIGLSSVRKLGKLLELTAFDPEYRATTVLRYGPRTYPLSELYKDNTVEFYREQHARAKNGGEAAPALIHFKPIALAKYHSKHNLTIQGIAAPIIASNGHDRYSVSVMLHCASSEIFDAVKSEIKSGERSFLLYASSPYVDLLELVQKKIDVAEGRQKDKALFVHARIGHIKQLAPWVPPSAQKDFGFEMPVPVERAFGRHVKM